LISGGLVLQERDREGGDVRPTFRRSGCRTSFKTAFGESILTKRGFERRKEANQVANRPDDSGESGQGSRG